MDRERLISMAVLIISDSRYEGKREDAVLPLVRKIAQETRLPGGYGLRIVHERIVPDEKDEIERIMRETADSVGPHVLLTCGGTGLSPRDVTPEATEAILHKRAPGISEYLRTRSLERTPFAALSRGTAGIRGRTLIVNLPGSPRAVEECLHFLLPLLPHAVETIRSEGGTESLHEAESTGGKDTDSC